MRHKKKHSAFGAIKDIFRPIPNDLYSGSEIHISDRGAVQIENCKRISLYNENAVEVDLGKCRIRLSGDELVLVTLSPGTISVEGRIFCVEFFY